METGDEFKKFFEMSHETVSLLHRLCKEHEDENKDEVFFLACSHVITDLLSFVFLKIQDKKERIEIVKEFCKMADEMSSRTNFVMKQLGIDPNRKQE